MHVIRYLPIIPYIWDHSCNPTVPGIITYTPISTCLNCCRLLVADASVDNEFALPGRVHGNARSDLAQFHLNAPGAGASRCEHRPTSTTVWSIG